jgi:hypothetical protein
MRLRVVILIFFALVLTSNTAGAQNITLEISEEMLNKLVDIYRLNILSDKGQSPPVCYGELPALFEYCQVVGFFNCEFYTSQPPPESPGIPMAVCEKVGGGRLILPAWPPVPWKYWVSQWKFEIADGSMQFHATVVTEVESTKNVIERNVPARIVFDTNKEQLRAVIDPFIVTLKTKQCSVKKVAINKKFSFAIPVHPQELTFPAPDEETRNIKTEVKQFTPQYLQDKLILKFDLEFK